MHPENSKRIFMLVSLLLLAVNWKAAAREAWHFLPTFNHDIRGIEARPAKEKPFSETVPAPAQKLLKPNSNLTEKQHREIHWLPACFPNHTH